MEFPPPIREIHLVADSSRKAEYHLFLYQLPYDTGFVITKRSGPAGMKQPFESWYRETRDLAERKFESILGLKTKRKEGRVYKPREKEKLSDNLSLF